MREEHIAFVFTLDLAYVITYRSDEHEKCILTICGLSHIEVETLYVDNRAFVE